MAIRDLNSTLKSENPQLALQAVSGMRSLLAPALLSQAMSRGWTESPPGRLGRLFSSKKTAAALSLLAAGELIADKLPGTPSRTKFVSLIGRALSGTLVAALMKTKRGLKPLWSGASVAVSTAYAAEKTRSLAHRWTHIPSPVLGAAEDGVALAAGLRAIRKAG